MKKIFFFNFLFLFLIKQVSAQFLTTGGGDGYAMIAIGVGAGNEVPLPVELFSFNANVCENSVCVTWITASETNNDYFTIEKSDDGVSFDEIATVAGAGNSIRMLNYEITDDQPYQGTSYYRLKQTDFDGRFKYFKMVAVNFNKSSDFSFGIFPNPNNGNLLNVSVESKGKENVLIVIKDITGKELYSKVIVTENSGNNICSLDLQNRLSAGTYFVTATSNHAIYNKLLVIK